MDLLPIDPHIPGIMAEVRRARGLALVAEPGAGKTTRVPPALIAAGIAGAGLVVVLEPRRVAARAAARRVAFERGEEVGGFAGYRVRFESCSSRATRVLFVTEGVLLRMLQADPGLEGVGAVVLDEFHERSLEGDLALALLAEVRRNLRPELALLAMSATLDAEPVAAFLDAPIVRVPGRAHPVEVEKLAAADARPLAVRVAEGVRRMLAASAGDVLAFLPGVGEIRAAAAELEPLARRMQLAILPLHGSQPAEEQDLALALGPRRKVVLATNVAETSLTVPGVTAVVDSGLARVASHDAGPGIGRLELRRISRASAVQRAGRAGRLGPGRVLQLWTAAEETLMPERERPEIQRADLAGAALELHSFGERDLRAFHWYEAPEAAALERAEQLLARLGAVDPASGAVTPLGRELARVPAHPRIARMLHEAARLDVLEEGALFAALLSERDPLRDARIGEELPSGPSDLLARADLLARGSAALDRVAVRALERARDQFARAARRAFSRTRGDGVPRAPREERLLRVVLAGFPDRVARRRRAGAPEALLVGGTGVVLARESVVRDEELFVVLDASLARRGERSSARVRAASAVRREWLAEVAGGALREERSARFDEARERVVALRRVLYEDLALEESETGVPEPSQARALLLEAARRDPERALQPGSELRRLLARIHSLASWCPELGLPALDAAALVEALGPWCERCTSFDDLRALPLAEVARGVLGRERVADLERLAPDALQLPSGSRCRLEYEPGRPPVLAARLQELFGQAETPTVAGGRVPVLMHLLGPNQRVVQVTQDLASFWNRTYPQVRKDLRARYPKHAWPDDPWTAEPTARTRRRR